MSQKTSGGVGFFDALTLLFIGLKLTGYITWSWLWVLAPFWGPIVLFLLLAAFVATIDPPRQAVKFQRDLTRIRGYLGRRT